MSDLPMKRGDSPVFRFQLLVDTTTGALLAIVLSLGESMPPNTVPVDVTGHTLWFTAKYTVVDPDVRAVVRLNSAALGGVVVTEAASGKFKVTVPVIATAGFPDGPVSLVFDVQDKDAAGIVTTVQGGALTVSPDVTRSTS